MFHSYSNPKIMQYHVAKSLRIWLFSKFDAPKCPAFCESHLDFGDSLRSSDLLTGKLLLIVSGWSCKYSWCNSPAPELFVSCPGTKFGWVGQLDCQLSKHEFVPHVRPLPTTLWRALQSAKREIAYLCISPEILDHSARVRVKIPYL